MNLFDDLIPTVGSTARVPGPSPDAAPMLAPPTGAAASRPSGLFDDLIPANDQTPAVAGQIPQPRRDGVAEMGEGIARLAGRDGRNVSTALGEFSYDLRDAGRVVLQMIGQQVPQSAAVVQKGGQRGAARFGRQQIEAMDRIDAGERVPDADDALGYQYMTPEQRESTRAEMQAAQEAFDPGDVKDSVLYRWGEVAGEAIEQALPRAEHREGSVREGIAEAFGSLAGFVGLSLATGGTAGAYTLAALLGAGDQFERAKAEGLDDEEALRFAAPGAPAGMIAVMSIDRILKTIPPGARGPLSEYAKNVSAAFGAEFVAENLSEIAQNTIEQHYNPERGATEGTPWAGLTSGTAAGIMNAMLQMISRRGAQRTGNEYVPPPAALDETAPAIDPATVVNGEATATMAPQQAPMTATPQGTASPSTPLGIAGRETLTQGAQAPATSPEQRATMAVPPPTVDRERLDSPRLTPEDRAAPEPNDLLDDGRQIMERALRGEAPVSDTKLRADTPPSQIVPETQGQAPGADASQTIAEGSRVEVVTPDGEVLTGTVRGMVDIGQEQMATDFVSDQGEASLFYPGEAQIRPLQATPAPEAPAAPTTQAVPMGDPVSRQDAVIPQGQAVQQGRDVVPAPTTAPATTQQATPQAPQAATQPVQASPAPQATQAPQPPSPAPAAPAMNQAQLGRLWAGMSAEQRAAAVEGVDGLPANVAARRWGTIPASVRPQIAERIAGQREAAAPEVTPPATQETARPARQRRRREPRNLIEYIAQQGGISINDPLVQDVRDMVGGGRSNRLVPGFGPLIQRARGQEIDRLRVAAIEAGWLDNYGTRDTLIDTMTVPQFLEIIRAELNPTRRGDASFAGQEADQQAEYDSTREAIRADLLVDTGLTERDITPEYLDLATMRVLDGLSDVESAYVEAVMQVARERDEAGDHRTSPVAEAIDDLPGWDDATLYGRPDQTAGDASPAGIDPAAQEQPGTVRDSAAGRERTEEAGRAPRETGAAPAEPQAPVTEEGADGLPQSVIPGAEARTAEDARAALTRQQREAEARARQQQSMIRRDGQRRVEDDEGGLFGEPRADMFDAPAAQPQVQAEPSDFGTRWDAMTEAERTEIAMRAGWTVQRGDRLNPTGRSIVRRSWSEQAEGTKATLERFAEAEARPAQTPDAAPDAPTFPTTLESIAPRGRFNHVYAEHQGFRYYLGSVAANADTTVEQMRDRFPGVSILTTDRADATRIHGDLAALEAAVEPDSDTAPDTTAAEPQAEARPPAPTQRIEDFGEKLEGARKDYAQKMRDAMGADVASATLAQSWPEPNYQQLLDDGADPFAVAFMHAARDAIPPKPRKPWKLREWVQMVESLRDVNNKIVNGEITVEALRDRLDAMTSRGMRGIKGRADLYQAVGHEKSLKGVSLSEGKYSLYGGIKYDPPLVRWTVAREAKATAFGNWPTELAVGQTRDEAIANFAARYNEIDTQPEAKRQVSFTIYSYRSGAKAGQFWIGKKVGRDYLDLRGFSSAKEAREYLRNNQAELEAELARRRDIPPERKESNSPRVGADHRNGADVTPGQFSEAFGFRGVQFGNYVEGGRRQSDLNEAYDALMDLAGVIGVPPRALSLNGELGLAFGARGKGGKRPAAAHYETGQIVINLTKARGAGSLAHEWWHGLDHYFSRQRADQSGFISERPYPRGEGVRPEVVEAVKQVMQAVNQTSLQQRSRELDKRRTKAYWSTGREMSARSFESYVVAKLQDQGASNDYLANIVSQEYWNAAAALGVGESGSADASYPYLTAAEIPAVRAAFDNLFNTIETRETDSGVQMFAARGDMAEADADVESGETSPRAFSIRETVGDITTDLTLTAPFVEAAANLESSLRQQLDGMGLKDVAVRVPQMIRFMTQEGEFSADGRYLRGVIDVALDAPDAGVTLRHESVHAMRRMGLFTETEWNILSSQSRRKWMAEHNVARDYGAFPEWVQVEEGIAYAFQGWQAGGGATGTVARVFRKIANFIEALGNALRGNEFQSVDDIFARVESGEVGSRGLDAEGTGSDQAFQIRRDEDNASRASAAMDAEDGGLGIEESSEIRGADRQFVADMGRLTKLAVYPRTIASGSASFRPVYQAAVDQFQKRDNIIADLQRRSRVYFDLPTESRNKVNQVLEIGRLSGREYRAAAGQPMNVINDVRDTELSKKGERISLTAEEADAYRAVRDTMNGALGMFRAQVTKEFGLDPSEFQTAKQIFDSITDNMPAREKDRRNLVGRLVREIEQAERTGYVPLSRFGNVIVTVKKPVDINEIDPLTGNPMEMETVWSRAVNVPTTGVASLLRRRQRLEQIPAVRQAMEEARALYGDDADAQIAAFQKPERGVDEQGNITSGDVDLLAEVANLDMDQHERLMEAFNRVQQEKGFRRHFLGSRNVPGYDADFERAIADYIMGIGGYLARREMRDTWDSAIDAIPDLRPNERAYAQKYQQYINNPTEEFSAIRQAGFFYFIAGNVSTAALNLTQVPIFTMPYMSMFDSVAGVAGKFTRAYADTMGMMSREAGMDIFTPEKAPADVRDAMKDAYDRGMFVPLITFEMMGTAHNRNRMLRGLSQKTRKVIDIAALTYSFAERANRISSYIAAYRTAKEKPDQIRDRAREILRDNPLARDQLLRETDPEAFARAYAEWVVDETHFKLGKVNRPEAMRGPGAAILQFKSFVWNALELQKRMAWNYGRPGKKAFALNMFALFMSAGIWGLPFAEDIREVFETVMRFWGEEDRDIQTEVREFWTELTGSPQIADIVSRGALRATGVDMSQRIGMGRLLPMSAEEAAGVPLSLTVGKSLQAIEHGRRGDWMLMAGEALPNFARNPIHGMAWGSEGIRGVASGQMVVPPEEIGASDQVMRGLGFQPAWIARRREGDWAGTRADRALDATRRRFYSSLARPIADAHRAMQSGDVEAHAKALSAMEEAQSALQDHNIRAMEAGESHRVIQINNRSLRMRVQQEIMGTSVRDQRGRTTTRGRRQEIRELYNFE